VPRESGHSVTDFLLLNASARTDYVWVTTFFFVNAFVVGF